MDSDRSGVEIWEFPDLIEREKGADHLGARDADKTKKKRRKRSQGDQFTEATAANTTICGYWGF